MKWQCNFTLFCVYSGSNAISVSLSPLNNFLMVGLAARRMQWAFTPKQMVAQIYKLKTIGAGEDSMEVCRLPILLYSC